MLNGLKPLTIFTRRSILDVWHDIWYASECFGGNLVLKQPFTGILKKAVNEDNIDIHVFLLAVFSLNYRPFKFHILFNYIKQYYKKSDLNKLSRIFYDSIDGEEYCKQFFKR